MSDDGPPRSGRDGVLWRAVRRLAVLADSSVRLDAPAASAGLAAKLNAHLSANAYYDGGGNWLRYDTTQPAAVVAADYANQQLRLYTAPAGANPIVFTATTFWFPDFGWAAAPYAANWSDWGAGEATGGYRKDAAGWVVLKGLVKKGIALVANDVIATLPAGYRPATEHIFACASLAGYTEVRVGTGGAVYIAAGGSAAGTSLANVRFDPAT